MTEQHIAQITEQIGQLSRRIDERFDAVDKQFKAVDERFTGVEKRLDKIEVRLDEHHDEIKMLAEQILIGQRVTNTKLDAFEETLLRRLEPLEVVVREHFKGTTPPQPQ